MRKTAQAAIGPIAGLLILHVTLIMKFSHHLTLNHASNISAVLGDFISCLNICYPLYLFLFIFIISFCNYMFLINIIFTLHCGRTVVGFLLRFSSLEFFSSVTLLFSDTQLSFLWFESPAFFPFLLSTSLTITFYMSVFLCTKFFLLMHLSFLTCGYFSCGQIILPSS